MEYLLIDARQRFLGTVNHNKALAVGDIFQHNNDKTYAVVGMNWSNQNNLRMQALTVVRVNRPVEKT